MVHNVAICSITQIHTWTPLQPQALSADIKEQVKFCYLVAMREGQALHIQNTQLNFSCYSKDRILKSQVNFLKSLLLKKTKQLF